MEDGKKVVELNPKKEGNPEFALADLGTHKSRYPRSEIW